MKKILWVLPLLLCLAQPAWAGWNEGVAAYQRKDYPTAIKEWRPLAEQGNDRAQYNLGAMHEGGLGVAQDYEQALHWYRKAAAQGNPMAQNNLGQMHQKGWGVSRSYQEAARWYQKAAEQGYVKAQTHLGIMYYLGRGVPKDYVNAFMWLSLAAAQGDKRAREYRNRVAGMMSPAQLMQAGRQASERKPSPNPPDTAQKMNRPSPVHKEWGNAL